MHLVNHKFHNCATVTTQLKHINAGIKLTVDQSVAQAKAIRDALTKANKAAEKLKQKLHARKKNNISLKILHPSSQGRASA